MYDTEFLVCFSTCPSPTGDVYDKLFFVSSAIGGVDDTLLLVFFGSFNLTTCGVTDTLLLVSFGSSTCKSYGVDDTSFLGSFWPRTSPISKTIEAAGVGASSTSPTTL